ncbi:hypothetical protein RA27_08660 [Ruegeria sp. ANG-R]|uniref:hypothetical protein n=1 Tax=Ruegeria sp. ANG-R TaxID=1577903 RepID=UPI0005808C0D|nr:hypothetical protein [Ruegeria sp. ANG-R]KIC43335.1 hypothetical protein RA27_08660 [Ruegeria sp. ANG-R]
MTSSQLQQEALPESNGFIPEGAEFVKLLNKIEKEIQPSTCRIMGFNYWPILRFQINAKRRNGFIAGERDLPEVKKPKSKKLKGLWSDWLSQFWIYADELRWLDETLDAFPSDIFDDVPQSDILYLNREAQYRRFGDTALQPLTDGLRWIIQSEKSQLTLTRQDPREQGEKFLIPTQVQPETKRIRPFALVKPKIRRDYRARQNVLVKLKEINNILEQAAPDLQLNEFSILDRLERTAFEMVYYTALFKRVRPKTVFLSSYSGANYVCAAARRLGVTVVDIQHGGMYPDHPLAANWAHTPKRGYELLPDVFWCWSEDSSQWISSTIANYHRTIVGGNPKSAIEGALQDPASAPDLPPRSTDGRPRVLVALQYGKNELIPTHVREAYETTKTSVAWYFRLHPAGRDRMAEAMQALDISAEEILRFSDCTEYQAMAPMDILLTDASTIVYRSQDIGLKTAVWSEMGAAYFSHLIQNGTLKALVSSDEIVEFVSGPLRPRSAPNLSDSSERHSQEVILEAFNALT